MKSNNQTIDPKDIILDRIVPDGLLSLCLTVYPNLCDGYFFDIPNVCSNTIIKYLTNENFNWTPDSQIELLTAFYWGIKSPKLKEVHPEIVQTIFRNIDKDKIISFSVPNFETFILDGTLSRLYCVLNPSKIIEDLCSSYGSQICFLFMDALRIMRMLFDLQSFQIEHKYHPLSYFDVFVNSHFQECLALIGTDLSLIFKLPSHIPSFLFLEAKSGNFSSESDAPPSLVISGSTCNHSTQQKIQNESKSFGLLMCMPEESLKISFLETDTEKRDDSVYLTQRMVVPPMSSVNQEHKLNDVSKSTYDSSSKSSRDLEVKSITFVLWICWMFLGLANNVVYVIINSSSKTLLASIPAGVTLFFNITPGLLVKFIAPSFANNFSYWVRFIAATILFVVGIFLAGFFTDSVLVLSGVTICSIASGWGESNALSLMSRFPKSVVSAWGAGTGMAGVVGASLVVFYKFILKFDAASKFMPFSVVFAAVFCISFCYILSQDNKSISNHINMLNDSKNSSLEGAVSDLQKLDTFSAFSDSLLHEDFNYGEINKKDSDLHLSQEFNIDKDLSQDKDVHQVEKKSFDGNIILELEDNKDIVTTKITDEKEDFATLLEIETSKSFLTRFIEVFCRLFNPMLCLFLVYLFEYYANAGLWASISFKDMKSIDDFYIWTGFSYQCGVLLSRTFSVQFTHFLKLKDLWIFPTLQSLVVIIGITQAFTNFICSSLFFLIAIVFVEGLLGGSCYSRGFAFIRESEKPHLKEFSLSVASIADSTGIFIAALAAAVSEVPLKRYRAQNSLNFDILMDEKYNSIKQGPEEKHSLINNPINSTTPSLVVSGDSFRELVRITGNSLGSALAETLFNSL